MRSNQKFPMKSGPYDSLIVIDLIMQIGWRGCWCRRYGRPTPRLPYPPSNQHKRNNCTTNFRFRNPNINSDGMTMRLVLADSVSTWADGRLASFRRETFPPPPPLPSLISAFPSRSESITEPIIDVLIELNWRFDPTTLLEEEGSRHRPICPFN